MDAMAIEEGQAIEVKYVTLEKASYIKFRAQSCDFMLISDHKAVLESSLRSFTCVTSGDTICIFYDDKKYELEVLEVQPNGAACIVETDCNVDFIEPVGYKQWKALQDFEAAKIREQQAAEAARAARAAAAKSRNGRVLQKAREETKETKMEAFRPFGGTGQRLGGRSMESIESTTRTSSLVSSSDNDKKESNGGHSDAIASAVGCTKGTMDSVFDDDEDGKNNVDQQTSSGNNNGLKEGVELICSDGIKNTSPWKVVDHGSVPVCNETTVGFVPTPSLHSRIGNKFSTKKTVSKSPPQFIGEGCVMGGVMKPINWRNEQEGPFQEEKQADK